MIGNYGWRFAALALALAACGWATPAGEEKQADAGKKEAKEVKRQTTCPVLGEAINRELFVDHDGKRIYVCCQECIETVKKDPAKYIKQLEDKGITLDRLQTTCPVMGGEIDKALYVDHDGKRIYLCCKGCIAAVKKDPAKYVKQMEDQGIALERAPETKKDAAGR